MADYPLMADENVRLPSSGILYLDTQSSCDTVGVYIGRPATSLFSPSPFEVRPG